MDQPPPIVATREGILEAIRDLSERLTRGEVDRDAYNALMNGLSNALRSGKLPEAAPEVAPIEPVDPEKASKMALADLSAAVLAQLDRWTPN